MHLGSESILEQLSALITVNTQFSGVFFCSTALRETIDRTELTSIYI